MTDPTPAPTPDFLHTSSFEKTAIWLPQLAVSHFNAGRKTIDGQTFRDCLIEGPAVLAVLDGCQFEGCNMGLAADVRSLLVKPMGPLLVGSIPFSNTRFIDCRFFMVGFTGSDPVLEQFETMLLGARAAEAAVADAAS